MKLSGLSEQAIQSYGSDGYIFIRNFLSGGEVARLSQTALGDGVMINNSLDLNDQSGKKTKLSLWFTPGNDPFGYLIKSNKMLSVVRPLLDSESPVCHFHSKLMQKEPKVGGAWEWHQDYGYWYKNQFMFPDQLISVMVALTPATKENGCIEVIKGSHKLGRVNHGFAGEQVGADMVMVNNALKTMDTVHCVMDAGDALVFHSNLLHRSAANLSDDPRWSIISCFSSQSNLAYNETSESWRQPIEEVPNDAILNWETESLANADFLKKENDPALKDTGWE